MHAPFFSWLVTASLHAAVLTLVIGILRLLLWRILPAKLRYLLWLPVVLVLLVPPVQLGRWSAGPSFTAFVPEVATAAATPAEPPAEGGGDRAVSWPIGRWLFFAWLAGALGFAGMGLAGYWRTIRRIRHRSGECPDAIMQLTGELAREAGLRNPPEILLSREVRSPAVTGFLRARLLLPEDFPEGFSEIETRLILRHELAHIRRGDIFANWVLCLLQALHWFNPVVWFAFGKMRADREAACDARVLEGEGADRRGDYGNALLKLQDAAGTLRWNLAFAGLCARSTGMRRRLEDIVSHRRSHPAWIWVVGVACAVLTAWGAPRALGADKNSEEGSAAPAPEAANTGMDLEAKLEDGPGEGKILRLLISSTKPIVPKDMRIVLYFYEKNKDGEIGLTESRTDSRWLTPPVDWADGAAESLTATYPGPSKSDNAFYGYTAGIYHNNELQAVRASPETLLVQFPIAKSIKASPPKFEKQMFSIPRQPGEDTVEILAGNTTMENGVAVAEGNVEIAYRGVTSRADRVEYDPKTKSAKLFRKKDDGSFELAGVLSL